MPASAPHSASAASAPALPHRRPTRQALALRWVLTLGLAGSISLLSGGSVPPGVVPGIIQIDKLIHVLVFGLLATAVYRSVPNRHSAATRTYWAVGLTVAFGLSDELHQGMNPERTMDGWDLLADALGAVLAVAVYRGWSLYRRVLEWRPFAAIHSRCESDANPRNH